MRVGLEKRGDEWRLPCEGLVVGQARIDYAYGLELTEAPERAPEAAWRLRVSTAFTVRTAGGDLLELDPEGPADALGPALPARHQQLVRGDVSAEGRLSLRFRNELHIDVPPHPACEAWTLHPDPIDGYPFTLVSPMAPDLVDWS